MGKNGFVGFVACFQSVRVDSIAQYESNDHIIQRNKYPWISIYGLSVSLKILIYSISAYMLFYTIDEISWTGEGLE